ncbi:unnamed protein product [Allacma fusca]|uniref:Serpin domain-containing protein n=1 Tax=Allacma fusca TaxID=39272 RepID=A0A8J2KGE1_9HEXA|nr:unnamed protein product [Allacma fusca]
MFRVSILVSATISIVLLCTESSAKDEELIRANNEFASRFYQVLTWENKDEDFIFCPLCITTTMAMLSLGSNRVTTKDIYTTIGFPRNETAVLEGYQRLVEVFSEQVKPTRSMFNGMFVSNSVEVEPDFQNKLEKYFHSRIHYLNPKVKRNTQILKAIQKQLNKTNVGSDESDYEDETMKYMKVMALGSNASEFEINLANYLDFKAGWEKKFDLLNTKPEPFYVNSSEILIVNTMQQTGHYFMTPVPELDAQAISIPYLLCDGLKLSTPSFNRTLRSKPRKKLKTCKSGVKDSRLQMIVLLPNSQDGLRAMERKFTRQTLLSIPARFDYKTYLDLRIPRFQMVSKKNVADLASTLLENEEQQDYNNLSKTSSLHLGRAFHRVSITVNERGSRTKSSLLKGKNPWTHPKIVRVDRPFLAFIHDKKTDVILIVMRVIRPRSVD